LLNEAGVEKLEQKRKKEAKDKQDDFEGKRTEEVVKNTKQRPSSKEQKSAQRARTTAKKANLGNSRGQARASTTARV
jgi:hypothetical protein